MAGPPPKHINIGLLSLSEKPVNQVNNFVETPITMEGKRNTSGRFRSTHVTLQTPLAICAGSGSGVILSAATFMLC